MNNEIKNLCKVFLMMCFLLIFVSCEKDFYEEGLKEQKRGITSRRITFDELKTNPKVIGCLNDAKEKLKPKLIGNERIINVGDFFIETDDVLLIEYGGLKSYTFPIYFTEEDAKLKNLVIAEKLDGTYISKVLEYDLTIQEKADLANDVLKTITNPIEVTRLNYSVACNEVFVFEITPCSHPGGPHNASNPQDWGGCQADVKPTIKIITQIVCGFGGGGDPTWDNPGNPPDTGGVPSGTGGTSSGIPYDYPNSQTNPEEYENGITQPVNPNLNNVNPTIKTPCSELIEKDIDSVFNAKVIELKGKASTQNFESAYALYQNPIEGLLLSNEFTGNANAASVNLTFQSNSTNSQSAFNSIGFMHCHLDNGTTFKVFSYSDIIALAEVATISTRPQNELAIYVTTNSGTFALKVSNKILLKNKKAFLELDKDNFERDFKKEVMINFSLDKQKLGFLKFINNMAGIGNPGIDLYEKNTTTNKWNLLTLSNNGTAIISIPCN